MLVVPVGGGLIAGCAVAATGLHAGTRVVGVEPAAGDDTRRSLAAGHRVTIATGLAALLAGRVADLPRRVGVVISGGNVDTERFAGTQVSPAAVAAQRFPGGDRQPR